MLLSLSFLPQRCYKMSLIAIAQNSLFQDTRDPIISLALGGLEWGESESMCNVDIFQRKGRGNYPYVQFIPPEKLANIIQSALEEGKKIWQQNPAFIRIWNRETAHQNTASILRLPGLSSYIVWWLQFLKMFHKWLLLFQVLIIWKFKHSLKDQN